MLYGDYRKLTKNGSNEKRGRIRNRNVQDAVYNGSYARKDIINKEIYK